MRILIVSKCPTHKPTAGNRRIILNQVELLRQLGCEVFFLYVEELPLRSARKPDFEEDKRSTSSYWLDHFFLFKVPVIQKLWFNVLLRIRRYLCSNVEGCDDKYPPGLARYVNKLDSEYRFDACIVNYYYLSKLLTGISIPCKAVFTHDYFAYKNLVVGEDIMHITAHSEALAMQRADCIFAVQEEERDYYRLISPNSRVYTVFSAYEYHPQPVVGNHNILFLSGDNQFNINGIRSFVNDVLPSIRKRFNDACLVVGGSICKLIGDYSGREDIKLLGYVDDPSAFYAEGDVAINPVYQGTGIKIKTFEAVSYDKVTLVHPHSSRGIYKPDNAPILICHSCEEWVSALEDIWNGTGRIVSMKLADESYISSLNSFVESEYRRFMEDAAEMSSKRTDVK